MDENWKLQAGLLVGEWSRPFCTPTTGREINGTETCGRLGSDWVLPWWPELTLELNNYIAMCIITILFIYIYLNSAAFLSWKRRHNTRNTQIACVLGTANKIIPKLYFLFFYPYTHTHTHTHQDNQPVFLLSKNVHMVRNAKISCMGCVHWASNIYFW